MWPFRTRRPSSRHEATSDFVHRAGPRDWQTAAPMPVVVARVISTVDAQYDQHLATRARPLFLAPLAHDLAPDGPAGVVAAPAVHEREVTTRTFERPQWQQPGEGSVPSPEPARAAALPAGRATLQRLTEAPTPDVAPLPVTVVPSADPDRPPAPGSTLTDDRTDGSHPEVAPAPVAIPVLADRTPSGAPAPTVSQPPRDTGAITAARPMPAPAPRSPADGRQVAQRSPGAGPATKPALAPAPPARIGSPSPDRRGRVDAAAAPAAEMSSRSPLSPRWTSLQRDELLGSDPLASPRPLSEAAAGGGADAAAITADRSGDAPRTGDAARSADDARTSSDAGPSGGSVVQRAPAGSVGTGSAAAGAPVTGAPAAGAPTAVELPLVGGPAARPVPAPTVTTSIATAPATRRTMIGRPVDARPVRRSTEPSGEPTPVIVSRTTTAPPPTQTAAASTSSPSRDEHAPLPGPSAAAPFIVGPDVAPTGDDVAVGRRGASAITAPAANSHEDVRFTAESVAVVRPLIGDESRVVRGAVASDDARPVQMLADDAPPPAHAHRGRDATIGSAPAERGIGAAPVVAGPAARSSSHVLAQRHLDGTSFSVRPLTSDLVRLLPGAAGGPGTSGRRSDAPAGVEPIAPAAAPLAAARSPRRAQQGVVAGSRAAAGVADSGSRTLQRSSGSQERAVRGPTPENAGAPGADAPSPSRPTGFVALDDGRLIEWAHDAPLPETALAVQREESTGPTTTVPSSAAAVTGVASAAGSGPPSAAGASAPAGTVAAPRGARSDSDIDELCQALYPTLRRRLCRDLLLDRERAGYRTDIRF